MEISSFIVSYQSTDIFGCWSELLYTYSGGKVKLSRRASDLQRPQDFQYVFHVILEKQLLNEISFLNPSRFVSYL